MKPKRKKSIAHNGKHKRLQTAVAKNIAKGMAPEPAMVAAGYSEWYARSYAHKITKHPVIQSILTASCQRIMKKRNLEFDAILEPLFDALQAKVVLKMPTLGVVEESKVVDHQIRMDAASRLIDLHRAKQSEEDDASEKQAPPVNLTINFVKTGAKVSPIVVNRPADKPSSTIPGVSFVKR